MALKLDINFLSDVDKNEIFEKYEERISDIFKKINDRTAEGSEMMGWLDWIHKDHTALIKKAEQLREKWISEGIETVVIIGTGGSYIGCKASLDFINDEFEKRNFNFLFVASFSERYLGSLVKKLESEKFAIVVISKSGTTLESSISFRILRDLLYKKEKKNYSKFIAAITDKSKGVLRNLSNLRNFLSFEIEDDIGGRYSTLTAVGIVPMVLASIDAKEIFLGAKKAYLENYHEKISENSSSFYACLRHYFFENKKLCNECIVSYDPQLRFSLEKMKQLFAESEGKNGKGLMPVLLSFTPDLHSVGQLLQDGFKSFFETIILVKKPMYEVKVEKSNFEDDDKLDWLAGKTLKDINNSACLGTLDAHKNDGKISNIVVNLEDWKPYTFGYFYFWLSLSAMFSSYLFEVNPFNQPGVENYKKRMFELLSKK